ncbi:MAG: aminotransferase class III-fold pyridoxal phosphate-dependent enzyme [Rhodanobacteraceae bacterium]|nr:MAG: aminotransferase class III-fold pyridoxal phosphate-dependent enzyme [Rhodanobacteraceae bacterium]
MRSVDRAWPGFAQFQLVVGKLPHVAAGPCGGNRADAPNHSDWIEAAVSELRDVAPCSPDVATSLAQRLYGIQAQAQPLPSEYDQVFKLVAADGVKYILKVMHPARDAAFIDLQCQTLRQLAARAPELALQRVIRTDRGEAFTRVQVADGSERIVWLLSYLPGKVLFDFRPHSPALLESLGELLGAVDAALQGFEHPAADRRDFKWDLSTALWIKEKLPAITDPARAALIEHAVALYEREVLPRASRLRRGMIYGDANDYNVLVQWQAGAAQPGIGIVDFGDMHAGWIAAEPAVAAAYALLDKPAPLAAAGSVVSGFNRTLALGDDEVAALFPLIVMRLAVSVVNSALRQQARPDDPYVTVSEAPAWNALERLDTIPPRFARAVLRGACGLAPEPGSSVLTEWLAAHRTEFAPIVGVDFAQVPPHVLDLGIGSLLLGADPAHGHSEPLAAAIAAELQHAGARVGVGRHDEARFVPDAFRSIGVEQPVAELATVHLGMDLFVPAGTDVHAPLAGEVHAIATHGDDACVVLHHEPPGTPDFFTLYRSLAADSIAALSKGRHVGRGQALGMVAANGSESAHVHVQIALDLLDHGADFPRRVPVAERAVWTALSPDPNLILGVPEACYPQDWTFEETVAKRHALLGPSLSISYRRPLKIVRGWRQYLYGDTGRPYLDMFNNVPLIGHSDPRVIAAVARQLALVNTNTRYLHDTVLRYAERLTALLPAPLSVCYFVNSGSEANELAIRMARTHTRAEDMLVLENAYHGNTGTVTDISPYKFDGPGGNGRKPWVHVAPIADDYRGPYRRGEPDLGSRYAEDVARILADMRKGGRRLAAYIAESVPSVGGQVFFPDGYLAQVYRDVRAAGGLCIADEVQVGFGRLGSCWWGFETQHVIPDIVVLAKPIANCFPLAAVVTTREIAASFNNGMEFFSTYGGNPVSCAAGLAVLDVLRDDHLQTNALAMGNDLIGKLRGLQDKHPLIGDVRGMGLFLGIDLVTDRGRRTPATVAANHVVNRLREHGVLAGTDGPFHNVIKLRPPLIIERADIDRFISVLDRVLCEDLPPG